MRVRDCVISVAEVNPYYGYEIPGWRALGLISDKVYDMYRDPAELERAATTFNGPLMIRHVPQTAEAPQKEYVGGTVYNVRFASGLLHADLLIMDRQAIDYVQSGELADLSSGYRFVADMTPGVINGQKFDGRMTAIQGNHVALVAKGRATGAHVADSALNSTTGVTPVDPNETAAPAAPEAPGTGAGIAEALMMLTAKLEALDNRLAAVEGGKQPVPQAEAAEVVPPVEATDESDDSEDKKDDVAEDSEDDEDDSKDKQAMDAASVQELVKAAVEAERKRAADVTAAKQACRNDLGDMIALDDAGEIYRAALKQRGVDVSAIPAGAERATYQAIDSVTRSSAASFAFDSNSGAKPAFDLSRIRRA
ncbi:head and packaging protein [Xanthomonas phage X2]|nr:head and packaging protein [Xanthomonas phage X2]